MSKVQAPSPPERTFVDLVWAGAAGNVGWSVATLIVEGWLQKDASWQGKHVELSMRVATLSLMFYYLHSEWLLLIDPNRRMTRRAWYWLGDGLLVLLLVLFAIALAAPASSRTLLVGLESLIFAFAAAWHIGNGWPESRLYVWVTKGALNYVGFAIVLAVHRLLNPEVAWHLPAAFSVVLIIWRVFHLDDPPAPSRPAAPQMRFRSTVDWPRVRIPPQR